MLFFASDVKPGSDAVTVYGPPTRMPGMTKRPSACVTASYVLPDGWCTASTVAPGITRALRVLDDAGDGAGRHALRVRAARGPQQDADRREVQAI